MRWYELTALILIGALSLGAYLFGTEAAFNGLHAGDVTSALNDTYYVEAHRRYLTLVTGILVGSGVVFGLLLRWGQTRLRALASGVAVVWCVAVVLTVLPQHYISLRGMPRRYIDDADGLLTAIHMTNAAIIVAIISGVALVLLLLTALIQRLRSRSSGPNPT
jgi:cytochrome c oxidase subunit 1